MKKYIDEIILPNNLFEQIFLIFGSQNINLVKELYNEIIEFIYNNTPYVLKNNNNVVMAFPFVDENYQFLKNSMDSDRKNKKSTTFLLINKNNKLFKYKLSKPNFNRNLDKIIINNIETISNFIHEKEFQLSEQNKDILKELFLNNYSEQNDLDINSKITKDITNYILQKFSFELENKIKQLILKIQYPFSVYAIKNCNITISNNFNSEHEDKYISFQENNKFLINLNNKKIFENMKKEEIDYLCSLKNLNNLKIGDQIINLPKINENSYLLNFINRRIFNILYQPIYKSVDKTVNTYKKNLNKEFAQLSELNLPKSREYVFFLKKDIRKYISSKIYNWINANGNINHMLNRRQAIQTFGKIIHILIYTRTNEFIEDLSYTVDNEENLNEFLQEKLNINNKMLKSLSLCKDEVLLQELLNDYNFCNSNLNELNNSCIPEPNGDTTQSFKKFKDIMTFFCSNTRRIYFSGTKFNYSLKDFIEKIGNEWKSNKIKYINQIDNLHHIQEYYLQIMKLLIIPYLYNNDKSSRLEKLLMESNYTEDDFKLIWIDIINNFNTIQDISTSCSIFNKKMPNILDVLNTKQFIQWNTISESMTINGINIIPLSNNIELKKESDLLQHCVKTYSNECINFDSFIFSIQNENNKHISTLELSYSLYENKFEICQHKAFKNAEPTNEEKQAVNLFLKKINEKDFLKPEIIEEIKNTKQNRKETTIYDYKNKEIFNFVFEEMKTFLPKAKECNNFEEWIKTTNLEEILNKKPQEKLTQFIRFRY